MKAVLDERLKRTLSDLIKEPMYIEGKACWLNQLDTALEKNNNRVHGTTKMTPFETSNNTAKLASQKLFSRNNNNSERASRTAKLASHSNN